LIAASFSIHIVVALAGCFFLTIMVAGRERRTTLAFCAVVLMLGAAFPVFATFSITAPGKPLYGTDSIDALTFIRDFLSMYHPQWLSGFEHGAAVLTLGTIFFAPLIFVGRLFRRTWMLLAPTVLCLTLLYVLPALFSRPWPTGRLLLPFIPPLLLTIVSAWDDVLKTSPRMSGVLSGFVFLAMAGNFAVQYAPTRLRDWEADRVDLGAVRAAVLAQHCLTQRNDVAFLFYALKYAAEMKLRQPRLCDQ
jgi:hypothetical protein